MNLLGDHLSQGPFPREPSVWQEGHNFLFASLKGATISSPMPYSSGFSSSHLHLKIPRNHMDGTLPSSYVTHLLARGKS